MARRSASNGDDALEIDLPQLELPACLLHQHLHFRLSAAQLGGRRAKDVDTLLEERQRGVQPGLLSLEGGKNLLEAPKAAFEIPLRRWLIRHDLDNIAAHSSGAQT